MKRFFNNILLLITASMALLSCQKETEYGDSGVIPVAQLVTPATSAELWLVNDPNATIMFEWAAPQQSTAQNYYVVFYDSATQGEELMRIDNLSTKCQAVVSHDDLVTMAVQAGIKSEESGEVYWSVIAHHGNNEVVASAARNKLVVTRYAAFDDYPVNLYLGGVADTEDQNSLRAFYNNGKGVYEIYAQILAGEQYYFTNRINVGNVERRFISTAAGVGVGVLDESSEANTPLDGFYHVTVDFYRARVTTQKITDIGYYFCWNGNNGAASTLMTYQGRGVWKLADYNVPTNDDRYRFRAYVDGVENIVGPVNKDLDAKPTLLNGSYYDVVFRARGGMDDWASKYKFMSIVQGQTADIYLYLNGSRNYHAIDLGNITPVATETINTPSELASSSSAAPFDLSAATMPTLKFSWDVPSGTYGVAPRYKIVFYEMKNNAMSAISSIDTGEATNFDVGMGALDNALSDIGIVASASGVIYWGVDTYILDKTVAQKESPKAMWIKRMSLPEEFYITGGATEYGTTVASAGEMVRLGNVGSGRFQIYTKLAAGTYNFVNGTTGTYKTYTLDGGKLVEGKAGIAATAGIYRITVDVAGKSLQLEAIAAAGVTLGWGDQNAGTFAYASKGSWTLTGSPSIKGNVGWDQDRYRFNATVGGVAEIWGYSRNNSDVPVVSHFMTQDASNGNNPPQWIFPRAKGGVDAWAYSFKASHSDPRSGNLAHDINSITIFMNGDAVDAHPHYHLTIKWLGYGDTPKPASTHYMTVQ